MVVDVAITSVIGSMIFDDIKVVFGIVVKPLVNYFVAREKQHVNNISSFSPSNFRSLTVFVVVKLLRVVENRKVVFDVGCEIDIVVVAFIVDVATIVVVIGVGVMFDAQLRFKGTSHVHREEF